MNPIQFIGWTIDGLIIVVCLFAWWKGAAPERWGGTINVIAGICAVLAHRLLPVGPRDTALLFADGVLAFGLLLLGVRYASLWIGAAMILQAIQFLLHTYYFVIEIRHDRLYATVNNLVSIGVMLCIFVGALLSWRRRGRLTARA